MGRQHAARFTANQPVSATPRVGLVLVAPTDRDDQRLMTLLSGLSSRPVSPMRPLLQRRGKSYQAGSLARGRCWQRCLWLYRLTIGGSSGRRLDRSSTGFESVGRYGWSQRSAILCVVLTDQRITWEYAQVVQSREPAPVKGWPIAAVLHLGGGDEIALDDADNVMRALDSLGQDGWELVGPPEVFSVVATHVDSGGGQRDRAYWVERRFWLKRQRRS